MSRDMAYLLDILLMSKEAQDFVSGIDKKTFLKDRKTQFAVIRCFEVMGEAVKRLSDDIQTLYTEIPWSKMAKMRDILIHAYDRVDLDEVWDTVQNDLPELIISLEKIIPPEDET